MALQPYFKENIYNNFKQSYWGWNRTNFYIQENTPKAVAPVIVIDFSEQQSFSEKEREKIIKEYNLYGFDGNMFIQGKIVERNAIIICVKK